MKGKIFNAQEVQAIIAGNKTQFRELLKPQIPDNPTSLGGKCWGDCFFGTRKAGFYYCSVKCPYQVGQKIFCKENFCYNPEGGVNYLAGLFIKATELGYTLPHDLGKEDKNAQHMKQEYSRLTLQIKDIRVKRLVDISCADYFSETGRRPISHMDLDCDTSDPRNDFKDYWNATHKKPEEKFEANPWVWVIQFEVVK